MKRAWWLCGLAVLASAGCGSEQITSQTLPAATLPPPTAVATTAVATTPVATSAVATAAPSSTALTVPASSAPPTAAPAPTGPPTTAAPPRPTSWAPTDLVPAAAIEGYSGNWCCADARSPAWPGDPAAPPADGFYALTLTQPWTPGATSLSFRVQRLELCSALPSGACQLNDDPQEMGPDPDRPLDLVVPLDDTTRVVVAGFKCWVDSSPPVASDGSRGPAGGQNKLGTGADLGDLFETFAADYTAVIAPLLGTGADPYTNPEQFVGTHDDGFIPEAGVCSAESGGAGPLRFVHGDAPMLLLQSVVDSDGNSLEPHELVQPAGVWYSAGTPTFMFYAGFFS